MTKQMMMNRQQLVILDNVISVIKLVCVEEVEGQWVKNVFLMLVILSFLIF